jgi:hypothetical protein
LKAEEKKAWKKIEETKKKAGNVAMVKERNNKAQMDKQEREIKKERER